MPTAATPLSAADFAALTLARTSGIGPVTYHSLLALHPNPADALANLPELCKARGRKQFKFPLEAEIQAEIDATHTLGAQFIFHHNDNYPELLKNTPDAPPVLVVMGNPDLLHTRQVAIVGNRNASLSGQTFTQNLAGTLADNNLTITSGLARGVDTHAHTATLQNGGNTVAVIAGGINHVYPPENKNLRAQIIEYGCLVTESPIGETPTARHFPRRNRIIAGLSLATVVTEAARNSGSLITAQYAGDYGRDVYAVPGNPQDARAAGPNHLLQQGAAILLNPDDLIAQLPQNMSHVMAKSGVNSVNYTRETQTDLFSSELATIDHKMDISEPELSNNLPELTPKTTILSALSSQPVPQDKLLRELNLPEHESLALLAELELMGDIQRHPGNHWSL